MLNKLVIAEIGSVHDGSIGNALKLVALAARCGAHVVKFQTHIASAETIHNAPSPNYFLDEPRYEYFERTGFSQKNWKLLLEECSLQNIQFLSSPFSNEAVDLLEGIGSKMYKIPSGEVTNTPLLEKISKLGKPVLLSSGMSSWSELDRAVDIFLGNVDLCVMQCTSAYPCSLDQVGLNVFQELRDRYGEEVKIGFSDHTSGLAAGTAAAALGATVIEKHLTFSTAMFGSDAANALEPKDFSMYTTLISDVWKMQDNPVDKNDNSQLTDMKRIFEKSIVSSRAISANTIICREDLNFKKPGDGISAADYLLLIGRETKTDLPIDHIFSMEDFE